MKFLFFLLSFGSGKETMENSGKGLANTLWKSAIKVYWKNWNCEKLMTILKGRISINFVILLAGKFKIV